MQNYLFVYGTLRRSARHPMHKLLATGSCFIGRAHYQGRLYQIAHYPGVVASLNPADLVVGELYQLLQPDLMLAELDHYEACSAAFAKPQEYRRELQQVKLENGDNITCWVYLYNFNVDGMACILSGDFLNQGIE
ncbi:gamma-glutamylcyclotransferase family protein [Rheinheimera baltica]|uniref:gamma-glutamylcyclotransferase family protein n=2 Tax=Rheinheimera baltica TaxID=67576 RepID=UPI00273EE1B8|nr:gamma-glutamylcyclotransferase family protein [Rheinheimera baltica]MDP5149390.1 gamma-glutamylcyclotransferase [Rheinheimera baltica]